MGEANQKMTAAENVMGAMPNNNDKNSYDLLADAEGVASELSPHKTKKIIQKKSVVFLIVVLVLAITEIITVFAWAPWSNKNSNELPVVSENGAMGLDEGKTDKIDENYKFAYVGSDVLGVIIEAREKVSSTENLGYDYYVGAYAHVNEEPRPEGGRPDLIVSDNSFDISVCIYEEKDSYTCRYDETVGQTITFEQPVRFATGAAWGQAAGNEYILFVMADGTVKYIDCREYDKNRTLTIKDLEKAAGVVAIASGQSLGGYGTAFLQRVDGSYYELADLFNYGRDK